jgi:tagaturonate reductase
MTGSTPIFQFGTSRFLQAHADLIIDEAMRRGQASGPVTVIQSSGDPGRARRLAALADPSGYRVIIRGLKDGMPFEREQRIFSIRRALSTATDWEALADAFSREARYVLSNTGEAGYAPSAADGGDAFDQAMSFPAKLQLLLRARYEARGEPVTVMPLELVRHNGEVLRARILDLAAAAPAGYRQWLDREVVWVNSLVDRIVSEPLEPAGAIAEPYALWAIEAKAGFEPPCRHEDIRVVEDLEKIETLKLFILNLGHTYLVSVWQTLDARPDTVAGLLEDGRRLADLTQLYEEEVLPAFAIAGFGDEARTYVATTIERFRNPYLHHALADISQNHAAKIERRIGGFLSWARARGDTSDKPRLNAVR